MKQRNNVRFFIRSLFALFKRLLKPQEKERFVRSFFYYFSRRRKRAYRELQKFRCFFSFFHPLVVPVVVPVFLFGGCSVVVPVVFPVVLSGCFFSCFYRRGK